jgi:UDP-glucose 4-epimerase
MGKKVAITGSSGFIGSHVIDECLKRKYEVTLIDRYGKRDFNKKCKFFLADVKDKSAINEVVGLVDGVINLAGVLGTSECVDNPYPAIETNIIGGLNVLQAIRAHKKRGVQIASGNWFMNNTYSITKNTLERFALMFNKEHKTQIAVVRGLSVYGPRQKHKPIRKIAPNFICKALRKEPIIVFGSGESIQDQVYVKDIAYILVEALFNENTRFDKVYEAGTGIKTTVNDVAVLVNRLAENPAGIKHIPMRPGEDDKSVILGKPDTLKELNIKPFTDIEEGYRKTINWYKGNYNWQKD